MRVFDWMRFLSFRISHDWRSKYSYVNCHCAEDERWSDCDVWKRNSGLISTNDEKNSAEKTLAMDCVETLESS